MNDVMWLKFYKYIDHLLLLGTPVRRSKKMIYSTNPDELLYNGLQVSQIQLAVFFEICEFI